MREEIELEEYSGKISGGEVIDENAEREVYTEDGVILSYMHGHYEVSGYRGNGGAVNIPAKYEGKPVTRINDRAFYSKERIDSIYIPATITSIGPEAFAECRGIKELTIPRGVFVIGAKAFYCCTGICDIKVDEENEVYRSIDGNLYTKDGETLLQYAIGKPEPKFTIPRGVKKIGDFSFYNCHNLTDIDISDDVECIGNEAFSLCVNIRSLTIGNGVVSIGASAFWQCQGIKRLTISSSVKEIGDKAFWHCKCLSGVTIPAGVTSIGEGVFGYCYGLTYITVEEGNTAYKSVNNILYTYDGKVLLRYAPRRAGARFVIPSGVRVIGDGAFSCSAKLKSIVIPTGVQSIGVRAFARCLLLEDVVIPSGVESIGKAAFEASPRLNSVFIPSGVESIGNDAFHYCKSLRSVNIPSSVTSIGEYVFCSCERLTIRAEATEKPDGWSNEWNVHNRPVVWGSRMPSAPRVMPTLGRLLSIIIPALAALAIIVLILLELPSLIKYEYQGLKLADRGDYYEIVGYTEVDSELVIPTEYEGKPIKSIGDNAFSGCTTLTSVTVPLSITRIGSFAFEDCEGLMSINIPISIMHLGEGVFDGCENITIDWEAGRETE